MNTNLPTKNNMKNTTIRKTMQGLAMSLLATSASHAAILYQQDFSSYSGVTNASTVGWSYSTTYGNNGWGIIQDQGTGTGPELWAISGWTHALTTPFSGNETQITVQSLMFPQAGTAMAGLYSQNFSTFFYPGWTGTGPQMTFSGGNFSLQQSASAGGASSVTVPVASVTAGNANFSMVIDVTTGLADGYFGSPETGTLLINDFDLKGSQTLSQFQTDLYSNVNVGVYSNQGLFDNITVAAIPEPSSAALLGGIGTLLMLRRRRA
jgi:hypothetical protein